MCPKPNNTASELSRKSHVEDLTEPTPERVLHLEPLSPAELRRDVADAAAAFPDADADRVPLHFDRADQVDEHN